MLSMTYYTTTSARIHTSDINCGLPHYHRSTHWLSLLTAGRITAEDLYAEPRLLDLWFSINRCHIQDIWSIENPADLLQRLIAARKKVQPRTPLPVWVGPDGDRYPVNDTMSKEWTRIDPKWYPDPKVSPSGLDLRYTEDIPNYKGSCAFDCALWVAVQLDIGRRGADEFTGRGYMDLGSRHPFAILSMHLVRYCWGKGDNRPADQTTIMRNVMRDLSGHLGFRGPLGDVTEVLDGLLNGVPQLQWVQLVGVEFANSSTAVCSAKHVKRRWRVHVVLGKNGRKSFGELIRDSMLTPNHPVGSDNVMVAGSAPYVLRVIPFSEGSGSAPRSWGDLLGLYTQPGLESISVTLPTASKDGVTQQTREYKLVGVVYWKNAAKEQPELNHYTAVWARGDARDLLHFDGFKQTHLGEIDWCLDSKLIPMALFYEVVLDEAKAS